MTTPSSSAAPTTAPAPPSPPRNPAPRGLRIAAALALAVYVVALAGIAFWPDPVDRDARPLLLALNRLLPWATLARVEFAANIALFVPLGILVAILLRSRHLVVPIAIVTTVAIEAAQAVALDRRTPSVLDIVANVTGACVGLLMVSVVEWLSTRRPAPG